MKKAAAASSSSSSSSSAAADEDPSTPPPPPHSSRPIPPWPVSPASYSSPETSTFHRGRTPPECPGAPIKNRYPRSRFVYRGGTDADDGGDDHAEELGLRPRRLAFDRTDEASTIPQHEGDNSNSNSSGYPILDMRTTTTRSSSSASSSPLQNDCPVLGLRPNTSPRNNYHRHETTTTTTPSMGVIPAHPLSSAASSTTNANTNHPPPMGSPNTSVGRFLLERQVGTNHGNQYGRDARSANPNSGSRGNSSSNSEWWQR